MVHKKKASAKTAKAVSAKSASVKKDARKVSSHRQAAKPVAKLSSKPVAAKAVKPVAKPAKSAEIRAAAPAPKAKVQAAPAAGVTKAAQPKAAAPVSLKAPMVAAKAVVAAAARPATPPRAIPAAVNKPDASRLTAPATPKHLAEKAAAARQHQISSAATAAAAAAASKKPLTQRNGFKTSEFIVYPAHGVGRIIGIEEQEIAGISLELFVIQFEKDKMTLRVPTGKSQSVGMRKLSDDGIVKRAMETLKGKARVKRTMWSRRAQEYEAKINSGDLIAIAEVVRDLYRSETQPEQSYSERQLYEAALDRMAREIAAVEKLDERGAMQRITEVLSKSAKGRRMAEEASGGAAAAETKAA
ncbi:MAG: CarD family transcriptional regulator [Hyphomicrobiaceae bacterium]